MIWHSHELGVESSVRFRHQDGLVVLVHLWQVDALLVQLLRSLMPPNGEVLFERTADVASMWSWLHDKLVEGLARTLPVACLHGEEASYRDGGSESEHPAVSGRSNDGAHQGESKQPAEHEISDSLSRQLLQLPQVQFFHLQHFVFSQVVILHVIRLFGKLHQYRRASPRTG